MNFKSLTLLQAKKMMENNEISPLELIEELIKITKEHSKLNFKITDTYDYIKKQTNHSKCVLPIAMKDNYHIKGIKTTCASKIMKDYCAPISATVVERLEKNNVYSLFKANLDEFAMGSTGMTSYFGGAFSPYKNHKNHHFLPGGSSSGSASAVASGSVLAATGSDTGGSIRQPAAWSGLVGFKPTYGLLSRYGIVELASSLDCPGFLTKDVADCEFLVKSTMGIDSKDFTTVNAPQNINPRKKIAVIRNLPCPEVDNYIEELINYFSSENYEIIEYHIPYSDRLPELYFILNQVEASSNLARFNKTAYCKDRNNLNNAEFRNQYFGKEVKRRILVGNYIKSKDNFHSYYIKTKEILQEIWDSMKDILLNVDAMILPSALQAMTVEEFEKVSAIDIYKQDQFTCIANLLGLPAMSVPVGWFKNQSPMGIQIVGNPLDDINLITIGKKIENYFNIKGRYINE